MRSMTGFGRGCAEDSARDIAFVVEICSINRKQLDLRVCMPPEMAALEPAVRAVISSELTRGSVTAKVVAIPGPAAAGASVKINAALLESLATQASALGQKLGLHGDLQLRDLLAIPGMVEAGIPDFSTDSCRDAITNATGKALAELIAMKEGEGDNIRRDVEERLDMLRQTVDAIEPLAALIPGQQRDKLLQRLQAAGLGMDSDDERILREIVIYCDRADVTEEIIRLRSHFEQFTRYLANGSEPAGRSLDFLIQEMYREITTLGNKAGSCEISHMVVVVKTELEKIREQVQNIE